MRARLLTFGPWQIPYACQSVLCSDGRRRYAKTASEADTYFSIPASVVVKGKRVSGYITGIETDGKQDYAFHAVKTGKNYNLLAE